MILDVVPPNVVKAMAEADMLGLIFFCIVFGISITGLPEVHRTRLVGFFESAFEAMMRLTTGVVHFAPIGVFGLMAKVVADSGFANFRSLGLYMATISAGLLIHFFLVLPAVMILLARLNPWVFLRNMTEPIAMAFTTSSSGATLPVNLKTVEERIGVPNRISSFVLPMGATVNMNGTALYECAGVLFIAQALGVDLTLVQQLLVVITALLAAIGAAAVPSAGLVMIFMVLEAVNLRGPQVEAIVGMMLAIDRPLDMCRTVVNIYGDAVGAAVVAKSEGVPNINQRVVPPA
jgi:Na+/H+-dicarboxylate symporter